MRTMTTKNSRPSVSSAKPLDSAEGLVSHLEERIKAIDTGRPSPVREEDGKLVIWASAIGSCPRKLWFYFKDRAGEIPSPLSTRLMASIGTDMHNFIQENLGDTVESIEQSFMVDLTDKLKASVRVDGIIKNGKKRALFEIKSVSDYLFGVLKRSKKVDPKYWAQAHCGMLAAKVKHAVFMFLKRPQKARSILTKDPLADSLLVRSMKFDAKYFKGLTGIEKHLRADKAPDRLPVEKEKGYSVLNWECRYCPFVERCFPRAVIAFRKNGKLQSNPDRFASELIVVHKK